MSKLNPLYEKWDVMYFRNLHKRKQEELWNQPVKYSAFYERLKSWMTLKEAIYTPSNKPMANKINMKPNRFKNLLFRFISLFR